MFHLINRYSSSFESIEVSGVVLVLPIMIVDGRFELRPNASALILTHLRGPCSYTEMEPLAKLGSLPHCIIAIV